MLSVVASPSPLLHKANGANVHNGNLGAERFRGRLSTTFSTDCITLEFQMLNASFG